MNGYKSVMASRGGGSSYTAGDGIDITNDVISTKQSIEGDIDEIIDVYPQAGNLVSIVNAFNKGDIYSTDEKMIGQWTDGKPLYQRVVELSSNVTITTSWTNIVAVDLIGCNLVDVTPVLYKDTSSTGLYSTADTIWYFPTNLNSYIQAKMNSGSITVAAGTAFILKYTKTTDTAISIGSETEYSTDEKVVGTWIDGKPLYQKTFVNLTLAKQSTTTLIENVDTCVECQTSYIRGGARMMGSFYFSSSDFVNMFGALNAEHNLYVYYDYEWYGTSNAISNINVIARYTKTTD